MHYGGWSRVASLGKTEIEIEIGEIITPILAEVIDSKDWTLIIDKEYMIKIPITYYRQKKVTFEMNKKSDSEDEFEEYEETETFDIQDLEEEEITSDEDEAK
ncbi:hypothetical protein RclHR1_02880025 [Rhizophagus clarus]|uniref:Uncharacterized protein n=1 Tax=Rhizophagus clarus TaxID=94130 RepID=A0A2Z6RI40_9GLOM|nr:hypothetical protein RclHR1_02880025 [Rhizophagus clarus]